MAVPKIGEKQAAKSLRFRFSDRKTPELIFAFVCPVGAGATSGARNLRTLLEDQYHYNVSIIKLSDIIREKMSVVSADTKIQTISQDVSRQINDMQTIGNALRKKYSHDYLAKKAVERIALDRRSDGFDETGENKIAINRRKAIIIDSLKHPAELYLLRQVYGSSFFLIGLFSSEQQRRNWLRIKGVTRDEELDTIMNRDQDEPEDFGQKVRNTFHLSDYFIRNEGNADELQSKLSRFLEIIFGLNTRTPNKDETAMAVAFSAAAKSACLSKRVGAAIYSSNEELIGVGWNDVPKFGGGLYHGESENDCRCKFWDSKIQGAPGLCYNDLNKNRLYRDIFEKLKAIKINPQLKIEFGDSEFFVFQAALAKTELRNLIEFSRAVHAEMEAIISVARGGKIGLIGSTIYTTTFPCHDCARHIIAAGISMVVFIEPYPKSHAMELHSDALTEKEDDKTKVILKQFEGISPNIHLSYFNNSLERKKDGKAVVRNRADAIPVLQNTLDGFTTIEELVVVEVAEVEGEQAR